MTWLEHIKVVVNRAGDERPLYHAPWAGMVVMLCTLALCICHGMAWVHETDAEFTTRGDFDDNGELDVVIVDKQTGVYRIAYQSRVGTIAGGVAGTAGVTGIEGFTVGSLLGPGREAMAFAAPQANRIQILRAGDAPMSVADPGVGPCLVVAVDVPGVTAAADELFAASRLNSPPDISLYGILGNSGTTFASTGSLLSASTVLSQGNALRLKRSLAPWIAVLAQMPGPGGQRDLRVFKNQVATPRPTLVLAGLPLASRFVSSFFDDASDYSQLLVYQPGSNTVSVRSVTEPTPGSLTWGPPTDYALPMAVEQLVVIYGSGAQLLVISAEGGVATVLDFDGTTPPVERQVLVPSPVGTVFTGAVVSGDGKIVLLSGPVADGPSHGFTHYHYDGSRFQKTETGDLPPVHAAQTRANVLAFEGVPLVDGAASMTGAYRAGDWSTAWSRGTHLHVWCENDSGPAGGLGDLADRDLVPWPTPDTSDVLVNQVAPDVSMHSLVPAAGGQTLVLSLEPEPGHYHTAVHLTLTCPGATAMYYRLSENDAWNLYSTPFCIFRDSRVTTFAVDGNAGKRSPIGEAMYSFSQAPDTLDSDGDGVPDYVELGYGLDPVGSGADRDGDGLTDAEELLLGTAPDNPDTDGDGLSDLNEVRDGLDHTTRPPNRALYDCVVAPTPVDGFVQMPSLCQSGTTIRAYSLDGRFRAVGLVDDPPSNSARLLSLPCTETAPLVAVATDEHFSIETGYSNSWIGREMIGLVPVPQPASVDVSYSYAGGTLTVEASNWVSQAAIDYERVGGVVVEASLDELDTLTAMLFEKIMRDIAAARGLVSDTEISLFPFRPADAGLWNPSPDDVAAFEYDDAVGNPGYRLVTLFTNLRARVRNSDDTAIADLRQLTREIYIVCSVGASETSGVAYRLPVDVLRQFIASGDLDGAYATHITRSLVPSRAAVAQLLQGATPRPSKVFRLGVRTNSFDTTCVRLWPVDGGVPKVLLDRQGDAFAFPRFFALLPGTELDVHAYTDMAAHGCGGSEALEVIDVSLGALPSPTAADQDGNLLADSWELLVYGHLGNDWRADSDEDSFSDLQEQLDGSNPLDGGDTPATGVADFRIPSLSLDAIDPGRVQLSWTWPAGYEAFFVFEVESTSDLRGAFSNGTQAATGATSLVVPLEAGATDSRFYRLRIRLR